MKINKIKKTLGLPLFLTISQIGFILIFAFLSKYSSDGDKQIQSFYPMFMDVHSMMFVGFGFLMTFLKRYGYGSVGYNFLIAAYVLEMALIIDGFISMIEEKSGHFEINMISLLNSDFCAASILISFGVVIGKASIEQLIFMATIEVVIQNFNEYIGVHFLKAYDVGESIYVHVFGAYFGLAVSKMLNWEEVESEKEGASYNSDLFAMIGTLFLWLYWPSFNSAVAVQNGQLRAIINTYLSITASCVTAFLASHLIGMGKLNMVHIQNATLSGGVAIGAIADVVVRPFAALTIGSITGIISTFGFQYLTPFLNKKLRLHDTCGVNNLHGMPGIISGIASAVTAAVASRQAYSGNNFYVFYPSRIPQKDSEEYIKYGLNSTEYADGGLGRSSFEQGGYQMAALVMTLGVAIVGGLITGLLIRLIFRSVDEDKYFDDEDNWKDVESVMKQSTLLVE